MSTSSCPSERSGIFHKINLPPLNLPINYKLLFNNKKLMSTEPIDSNLYNNNGYNGYSGSRTARLTNKIKSINSINGSLTSRPLHSSHSTSNTKSSYSKEDLKNYLASLIKENENEQEKENQSDDKFFITSVPVETKIEPLSLLPKPRNFSYDKIISIDTLEIEQEEFLPIDIMAVLDNDKMELLKSDFLSYNKPLTIYQFVAVILPYIPKNNKNNLFNLRLIASLCQLFSDVDVNGDGTMEWEEFTNFIIDAGMNLRDVSRIDRILEYKKSNIIDISRHDHSIEKIFTFDAINHSIVFNRSEFSFKVHNSKTFKFIRRVQAHTKAIYSAEFIPPRFIVTSSADCTMLIFDAFDNYKCVRKIYVESAQLVLRWKPDNNLLFSAGTDHIICARTIEIAHLEYVNLDIYKPPIVAMFRKHTQSILDLIFLPNLNYLASASLDKTIILWDLETFKVKHILTGHSRGVYSITYNSEFHCLISAGFDHDALLWNPYYAQCIGKLKGHYNSLVGVQSIKNTPQIITVDIGGIVKVWDIRNFACVQTITIEDEFDAHVNKVMSFQVSDTHKRLILGGNRLYAYDSLAGIELDPLIADQLSTIAVLYNETTGSFLTVSGSTVKVWSGKTGYLQKVYRNIIDAEITAICFDNSQKKIIIGDSTGKIRVFNVLSGAEMVELSPSHNSEVTCLVYNNAKNYVISSSWDRHTKIYDESQHNLSSHLVKEFKENKTDITCLAHSNELALIVTGAANGSLIVWDYEANCKETELIGHTSEITAMTFLNPYPLLATSDMEGNLCIWIIRPILNSGACILRMINTQVVTEEIKSITALQWVEDRNLLVVGDDAGFIKIWNISKAIETWNIAPFNEKELILSLGDSYENTHSIAGKSGRAMIYEEYNRLHCERIKKINYGKVPKVLWYRNCLLIEDINLCGLWRAHSQAIRSVTIIYSPLTVVTCSYDCKVILWDFSGKSKGQLYQCHTSSESVELVHKVNSRIVFEPFKFKPCLTKKPLLELAKNVLYSLKS